MGSNSNSQKTTGGAGQGSRQATTSSSAGDGPSEYAFVKAHFGDYQNFMHSYGLRLYEPDDVEESKAILRGLMEHDRLDRERERERSSGGSGGNRR